MEVYFLSFGISAILAFGVQWLFLRFNQIDQINARSSHATTATRTGGIGIFLTVLLISLYFYLQGVKLFDYGLFVPLALMFAIGVYDDFYQADYKLKLFVQLIVAKILIDQGYLIDYFHGVFGWYEMSRVASQLFTGFVFLVIVNAFNFIDGLDGLALSQSLKAMALFVLLTAEDHHLLTLIGLVTAALIPLFYFNLKPNKKVFLGDGGSLFLGSLIAVLAFEFLDRDTLIVPAAHQAWLAIFILAYPLLDLLRIFIVRLRQGKSPFQPDANHLHHLLLQKLQNHLAVVSTILLIEGLFIGAFIYFSSLFN
ncbi:MAG: glycosyltransferase family 4 protein [Flavobacteriaceae bacterium]